MHLVTTCNTTAVSSSCADPSRAARQPLAITCTSFTAPAPRPPPPPGPQVYARMQTPNLPGVRSRINVFNFDKETLERAGMGDMSSGTPPFLVRAWRLAAAVVAD